MAAARDDAAFGQTMDLCARLREILHDYPDSAICKEMLQNADDAGAATMRIVADRRTHATDGLLYDTAADFQGPALLFYNDSVFTDEDLASIQRIGQSCKRDNVTKTGRFGIGFNSVYHVSDQPSFVSAGAVCIFDPSCRYLPGRGPGYKVNFTEPEAHARDVQGYTGQWAPYNMFGCDVSSGKRFEGTLFRLPLRRKEQAATSKLRKVECGEDFLDGIARQFTKDAAELLVFLKSVRALELYDIAADAGPGAAPTLRHRVCLRSPSTALLNDRAFGARIPPKSLPTKDRIRKLLSIAYHITLCIDVYREGEGGAGSSDVPTESQTWVVAQSTGAGTTCGLSTHALAEKYAIKLLPWGGAAVRMDAASAGGSGATSSPSGAIGAEDSGKAYCFLPLAVHTGLPVHVNGYFELPSDRRGIFWGDERDGEAGFRRDWNAALLLDVIPKGYMAVVRGVWDSMQPKGGKGVPPSVHPAQLAAFYRLLPSRTTPMPYQLTVAAVATMLLDVPCVWAGDSRGWRKPVDCLLANAAWGGRVVDHVIPALRTAGIAIAVVPPHVFDMLTHVKHLHSVLSAAVDGRDGIDSVAAAITAAAAKHPDVRTLSVAEVLRVFDASAHGEAAAAARQWSTDDACCVLQWVLEEAHGGGGGGAARAEAAVLPDAFFKAPLAPLASGKIGRFAAARGDSSTTGGLPEARWFTDRVELLGHLAPTPAGGSLLGWDAVLRHPGLADLLLSQRVRSAVHIADLTARGLLDLFPSFLPDECAPSTEAGVVRPASRDVLPRLVAAWRAVAELSQGDPAGAAAHLPATKAAGWACVPGCLPPPASTTGEGDDNSTAGAHTPVICAAGDVVLCRFGGARSDAAAAAVRAPLLLHARGLVIEGMPVGGAAEGAVRHGSSSSSSSIHTLLPVLHALRVYLTFVPAAAGCVAPDTPDGVVEVLHMGYGRVSTTAAEDLDHARRVRAWVVASQYAFDQHRIAGVLQLPVWRVFGSASGAARAGFVDGHGSMLLLPSGVADGVGAILAGGGVGDEVRAAADARNADVPAPPAALASTRYITCTPAERGVLLRAGMREEAEAAFWRHCFLPAECSAYFQASLPRAAYDAVVHQLLRSATGWAQDAELHWVKEAAVIPTRDGAFRKVTLLFDPTAVDVLPMVPASRVVDDAFITGGARGVKEALTALGMMTSLTQGAVLELAMEYASYHEAAGAAAAAAAATAFTTPAPMETAAKAILLLEYLDRNFKRYVPKASGIGGFFKKLAGAAGGGDDFFTRLAEIAWFPVRMRQEAACAPCRFEGVAPVSEAVVADAAGADVDADADAAATDDDIPVCLMPACDVRPAVDAWVCSATKGILLLPAGQPRKELCEVLGWTAHLKAEVYARQLLGLSKRVGGVAAAAPSGDVNRMVVEVYTALDRCRRLSTTRFTDAVALLRGEPCVWVGDRFVLPDTVAEEAAIHDLPNLHMLPATLRQFAPLLRDLGMVHEFTPDLYAQALMRMHDTAPNRRLPDAELCVVGAALLTLSKEAAHLSADVVLPNSEGILCRPSALLFDDMKAWDQVVLGSEELKGRSLVHDVISHHVAESFGVPSRRMMVAADGIADWDVGEAYGQSESITARIKAIIGDYVDDVGIVNELIQNADDAGATKFALMLDKSTYGTQTLLGTSMEPHQGPAMVVYNNATFTEADFQALASLGQGSKLESTSKTGKFGLGFNSVYHFTDVPSFVSGGSLVFLDPHRTSLKGTKEGAPGLKIIVPNPICNKFADQFMPYQQDHFACTLKERFPGTLFRFPLRTEAVAARSKIRNQSYTVGAAEALLHRFCDSARDLLLFLRNLRSVEVLVREHTNPDDPTSPLVVRKIFDMNLSIPPDAARSREAVHRFIAGQGDSTRARDALRERLRATPDEELPTSVVPLVVKSRSYVASAPAGAGDAGDAAARGVLTTPEQTVEEWIVSSVVGGGEVKRLAIAAPKGRRWIPLAGVALRVACNGKPSRVRGRAFAFLPLPQATGLQFHLNAAFELSANRRNIWFDDFQAGGEASQWNAALLQDACVPAALALLEAQKQRLYLDAASAPADAPPDAKNTLSPQPQRHRLSYYDFFPGQLQTGPAWVLFAETFFKKVASRAVLYSTVDGGGGAGAARRTRDAATAANPANLLPGKWVSPVDAVFITPGKGDDAGGSNGDDPSSSSSSSSAVVERALLNVGVPIVSVAGHVYDMLCAQHAVQVVSPDYVRSVFKRRDPSAETRPEEVMQLLKYSVRDLGHGALGAGKKGGQAGRVDAKGFDELHGLPFLPLQSKRFVRFTAGEDEGELVFYNEQKGLEVAAGQPQPQQEAGQQQQQQQHQHTLADVLVDRSLLDPVGVFHKQMFYLISEATNLKRLSAQYLSRLLPMLLPNVTHLKKISKENPHAPSPDRIAAFWKIIGDDPVEGNLRGWPLLPTQHAYISIDLVDTVVQDTVPSAFGGGGVGVRRGEPRAPPAGIPGAEFLEAMDVEVMPPGFAHPRIPIKKATPAGVLRAFAAVHGEAAAAAFIDAKVPPEAKLELTRFLARHDRAAELAAVSTAARARGGGGAADNDAGAITAGWERAFVCGLPIWRVSADDATAVQFAAIDGTRFLAPLATPRDVLSEKFYAPANDAERRLLVKLGVVELAEDALYADHILADLATAPRFVAGETRSGEAATSTPSAADALKVPATAGPARDKAIQQLHGLITRSVQRGPQGVTIAEPLKSALTTHAWVPTEAGAGAGAGHALRSPKDLFDPQLKASGMALPASMFPRGDFATPAFRGLLLSLGMQTQLTGESIKAVARGLPECAAPDIEALKLLRYVDAQLEAEGRQQKRQPPHTGGAAAGEPTPAADLLAALADVECIPVEREVPPSHHGLPWAVGAIPEHGLMRPREARPLEDAPLCSCSYGIAVAATPARVVAHLRETPVPHHVLVKQLEVLADDSSSAPEDERPARDAGSNGAAELYTELSVRLRSADEDDLRALFAQRQLAAKPVVYLGVERGFVAPAKVAYATSAVSAEPWLYDMPDEYLGRWVDGAWQALGEELKIREYFGPGDYAQAVRGMATAQADVPLAAGELQVVCSIALCVAASDAPKILTHLPDAAGYLRPIHTLLYDDMAWEEVGSEGLSSVVHPSIPADTAKALGVQSRRHHLQVKSQMKEGLSCPTTDALQALLPTSGITYLLQDLLEVAYLAQATKVTFVLDHETHESRAIMAGSEVYQGPALLMNIDAALDVQEVSDLFTATLPYTSGAKLVTCFTITDCVQVAAHQHLLLYAPLAAPARYKLSDVRANFPSQLKAFRGLERQGTTVRMPLRTEPSALGHPCSPKDIDRLLQSLGTMAPATLPFLPKLMQVTLTEYRLALPASAPDGSAAGAAADATATAPGQAGAGADGGDSGEAKYVSSLRLRAVVRSNFQSAEDPRQRAWSEDFGSGGWLGLGKAVPVTTFALHVDVSEVVDGDTTLTSYMWGVCLVLGDGDSAKLAKTVGVTPIGGVAALLRKNGNAPTYDELRTHGLHLTPVPQFGDPPTQLPVHLFSMQLNAFRTLPFYGTPGGGGLTRELLVRWNAAVLENTWKAYSVLLSELCGAEGGGSSKQHTSKQPHQVPLSKQLKGLGGCYAYFPHADGMPPEYDEGVARVYRRLAKLKVFLLNKDYKVWSVGKFALMPLDPEVHEILQLHAKDMHVFNVPLHVAKQFCRYHTEANVLTASDVRKLCHKTHHASARIAGALKSPAHCVQLLALAASDLRANTASDADYLDGVTLLPLQGIGDAPMVLPFGQASASSPVFIGDRDARALLPKKAASFVHHTVFDSEVLRPLLDSPGYQERLGLRRPDPRVVLQHMPYTPIPPQWKHQQCISADERRAVEETRAGEAVALTSVGEAGGEGEGAGAAAPSELSEWLRVFWSRVTPDAVQEFAAWPLLPMHDGSLRRCDLVAEAFSFPPKDHPDARRWYKKEVKRRQRHTRGEGSTGNAPAAPALHADPSVDARAGAGGDGSAASPPPPPLPAGPPGDDAEETWEATMAEDIISEATDSEALSLDGASGSDSDSDSDVSSIATSIADADADADADASPPREAPVTTPRVPALNILHQPPLASASSSRPGTDDGGGYSLLRGLKGLSKGVMGVMGLVADSLDFSARKDMGNMDGKYDPMELKAWAHAVGAPVMAEGFAGGTRFQPKGTPAQVIALKVAASKTVRWGEDSTTAGPAARRALLKYFARHAEDFAVARHAAPLKTLPIFPTLAARADPDAGHPRFTTLDVHRRFSAALPGNPFFKPGPEWIVAERVELLKTLCVKVDSATDVWVEELLPKLHQLDYESRYQQLTYVRDHVNSFPEDEAEKLIGYMKDHPLFECCSGRLVKPSEFLHPHLELIKEVFGDERSMFPEGGYSEPQWLRFLEQLGMKAEIDADVFLACARKIHDHSGRHIDAAVAAKAAMIMDMLKKDWDTLLDTAANKEAFIAKVRDVAIVPLRDPTTTTERKMRLYRFRECVLEKDAPLVVSLKPAIPEKWLMRGEYYTQLGIVTPPSLQDVKLAVRTLSEALLADYPLPSSPTDDFCKVLAHLERHQPPPVNTPLTFVPNTGRTADMVAFGKTPCLPITDSVLCNPSRAFMQLDQHRPFPPYVQQVPAKYHEYKSALKLLGVKDAPEPEDYGRIVKSAYAQQQQQAVAAAEGGERGAGNAGAGTMLTPTELNSFMKLVELMANREIPVSHVPTEASRLCAVGDVVFNNAPWLAAKLKADTLSFVHPRVSKGLATRLRITPLSGAIVESLVGDPLYVQSDLAATLTARLRSTHFRDCLVGLCEAATLDAPDLVTLTRTLAAFEVRFVEDLRTRIFLPDPSNPRRIRDITGDSGESLYYVDEEKRALLVAAPSDAGDQVDPSSAVARGVATMLRLAHPPPFLAEVLQVPPDAMRGRLQILQIAGVQERDPRAARGVLGEKLVAADAARVHLAPTRQHAVGECIAFEDRAKVLRYGEVVAAHRNEADMWEYEVRVAPSVKQVLPCTAIYCLPADAAAAPGDMPTRDAAAVDDAAAPGDADGDGGNVAGAGKVANAASGGGEKEMMRLMLAQLMEKLDIPLDPGQADLLSKLEASQRELLRSRTTLEDKTRTVDRLERRNQELEEQLLCKICFVSTVDVVVTCGHAVCGDCVTQIDKCPFCRKQITSSTKLCIA